MSYSKYDLYKLEEPPWYNEEAIIHYKVGGFNLEKEFTSYEGEELDDALDSFEGIKHMLKEAHPLGKWSSTEYVGDCEIIRFTEPNRGDIYSLFFEQYYD